MKNTNKGKKKITNINFDGSIEIHSKKPRYPNWEHGEILAFIKVKKEGHITTLNKMDPQDQFQTMVTTWKKYSTKIMIVNFFQHTKNGPMCKNKWGSIFKEFKKIFDYSLRIGQNEDY